MAPRANSGKKKLPSRYTKSKAPSNSKKKNALLISSILVILLGVCGGLYYLHKVPSDIKPISTENKQQAKKTHISPKELKKYDYTQILENKEFDTGSGVKRTRNYDAENAKQEAEYRKKLAQKRKAKQDAFAAKAKKEAELRQKRLEEREKKRQQELAKKNKNIQVVTPNNQVVTANNKVNSEKSSSTNTAKYFVQCNSDNYRTAKEAETQKAKLAFIGKSSTIVLKQMGGGYVYSLNIGPYDNLDAAIKSRNDLVSNQLGKNCSPIK